MENGAKVISFKGTAEGLVITIPVEMETDRIMDQIAMKVKAAERFFRGAKLKVIYRGKKLSADEEKRLVNVMQENSSVTVEDVKYEVVPPPVEIEKPQNISGMPLRRIYFKDLEEGPCKFIRGTVRGGTRILFEGNVVVIGDVNPGSEIVAAGNVVIFGALRGMVHAGADGNRDAFVAALRLAPTQLRIGDIITRCPDTDEDGEIQPEIAVVREGRIYVEPL
ncbi:septum site-determining protein MinC [Thermoclostridium stercorarium subsp. leptospartum DSM 9219]|uniref:Probable septum site-determining protein MinC n=2 Tax=Thermoclostridium stercorarium TaxID=1510 RepID=A0A1B1YI05_THEST|nr:septum site-determining protein MinC [Thermoclostridium stercorarium]ANX00407.1 septum site-determining protein MinC [Thermoclostridium stercorarium subsp. leptospartum DSM 9219]